MPSKEPIRYDTISIDYRLQNGNSIRAGFLEVKIHCLDAKGTPFVTAEFNSNGSPDNPKRFLDEREHKLGNASSEGVVHNLSAYSFLRVHASLRGTPKECIDDMVKRLMAEVASKVGSREAMLQFYAVMGISPPEGFDDFYPPKP
ncbi:hypothetical protein HYV85_00255 [Candidatus Woesearchaeota archaeon]|nr:hypothetical protein [Candidatus Woesearchaeota archaeon]